MIDVSIDNHIATISINRPKANALSAELINDLGKKIDALSRQNIKVILLRGEGKFFCAGADIKEFTNKSSAELSSQSTQTHTILNQIESSRIPVIALLKGAALGGGLELAMACHIRFATLDCQIGLPEFKLGLIPGYSGIRRLQNIVGRSKALEMMLSSEVITGIEAEELQLVSKSFASEAEMERHSLQLAQSIANFSMDSINGVMEIQAIHDPAESDVKEAELFGNIFDTQNAKEGISAFIEKRTPRFH